MYEEFVRGRLVEKCKKVHDPIKRVPSKIFISKKKTVKEKTDPKQSNVQLFSRLFIVSESRQLDLDTFFEYENQQFPPALSLNGCLRSGNKSHLTEILEKIIDIRDSPQTTHSIIYDGAALVHMLPPRKSKTFFEYFHMEFITHIHSQASIMQAKRVDVVWDLYISDSIKKARDMRGSGVRRQVLSEGSLMYIIYV